MFLSAQERSSQTNSTLGDGEAVARGLLATVVRLMTAVKTQ